MDIFINYGDWPSMSGTQGSDIIFGGPGDEYLSGFVQPLRAGGITLARQSISDAADFIFGGSGNDTIYAGGGNDVISGGAGNDVLDSGPGTDRICGGEGADIFRFALLEASPNSFTLHSRNDPGLRDLVLDFRPEDGDRFDLTQWQHRDNPGATFIGEGPTTAVPSLQVGFYYEEDRTVIELYRAWSYVGPGEMLNPPVTVAGYIEVLGIVPLTADHFIL